MSLEILKQKTEEISKCLSLQIDRENGDEVSGLLQQLVWTQDDCAKSQALADMILAEKVGELYSSAAYVGLSATDKKSIINGRCSKELYYCTLTARLSSSISHAIEAYRSILSDLKEQRRQYGQNG